MDLEKRDPAKTQHFAWNFWFRKEFNSETHFAFVDYEKRFDNVNLQEFFSILKEKNKLNILLKIIHERALFLGKCSQAISTPPGFLSNQEI
jgi:hypothetical protein